MLKRVSGQWIGLGIFLIVIVGVSIRHFWGGIGTTDTLDLYSVQPNDTGDVDVELGEVDALLMDGDFAGSERGVVVGSGSSVVPIVKEFSDESFVDIFSQAKTVNDRTRQFVIVDSLYKETQNISLLPYLINMAVQLRNFDDALQYVARLENAGLLYEAVDPQALFSLLFNGLELTFKDIAHIKEVLEQYKDKGLIDDPDFHLRSALITYSRGDMENYHHFMYQLSGTVHNTWLEEYKQNISLTEGFTDVPDTYIDGLTALQIFGHGYYQVARHASKRLTQADETYILPRQLHGYASLLLGDRGEVLGNMTWLREKDEDNDQLYTFLAGIAHFHQEQYTEAVLLLRDIRDSAFSSDALRYLLLSYIAIDQYDALDTVFSTFLDQSDFVPHDFFTLFDLLFYEPLRERKEPLLYTTYPDEAKRLIDECYINISEEYAFICLRGKAGLLLTTGDERRAYQYLQRLVKRYPKSFLFEALGDIAFRFDNIDEAKSWFIKSISVSQDEVLRQEVMHKVRSAILQGKQQD